MTNTVKYRLRILGHVVAGREITTKNTRWALLVVFLGQNSTFLGIENPQFAHLFSAIDYSGYSSLSLGAISMQHIGRRFFLSKSRQVWAMINIQSQKPRVEFGLCKVSGPKKMTTWKPNTVVSIGWWTNALLGNIVGNHHFRPFKRWLLRVPGLKRKETNTYLPFLRWTCPVFVWGDRGC